MYRQTSKAILWSTTMASVAATCCIPFAALAAVTGELEEVVVTSQRREESLQKVPASISVFSGEKLDASNVSDVRGYFMQTPNVTFQEEGKSGPRSVDIAMRGISNIVTDRDTRAWRLKEAAVAAQEAVLSWIAHR